MTRNRRGASSGVPFLLKEFQYAKNHVLVVVLLIVCLSACDELISILTDREDEHISNEIPVGIVLPFSGKYVQSPYDPLIQRYLNVFQKLTRHNAPHSDSSSRTIKAR